MSKQEIKKSKVVKKQNPKKQEVAKKVVANEVKPVKVVEVKSTKKPVNKVEQPKVLLETKKVAKKVETPKVLAESKKNIEVSKKVKQPKVIAEPKKVVEVKKEEKKNKKQKFLFKVVQKYQYEDILNLKKFHFYNASNNKMLFKYFKFIFIFTAIMFMLVKVYELSIFSILMLVLYPIAMNREIEKRAKMEYDSNKFFELENTFLFYEDYFEVLGEQGSAKIFFNQLYDLVEVEEAYYLFISAYQAIQVKKSNINEDFYNYIKTKPGFRISIKKTKRLFR